MEVCSIKYLIIQRLIPVPNIDILITSFPQSWGETSENGKNGLDFFANLIEYIRGPRDEPFLSVRDLAFTIVERCCTIFTSDVDLLTPDPRLLEIYQEAIGDVASNPDVLLLGSL
jgi:hypothetical protein